MISPYIHIYIHTRIFKPQGHSTHTYIPASAEIAEFDLARLADEDISRLDIPANVHMYVCISMRTRDVLAGKFTYCHSHNNRGPRNGFERLLEPVYYWNTVEKLETDPQIFASLLKV
jgi:hypothetical protein